jgi:phosphoribosylformylglycinamidine synthase
MVGILESIDDRMPLAFLRDGLSIILLGETRDELGGSELLQLRESDLAVRGPSVDLEREKALIETILEARAKRLIESAHDLGTGGLAIAIAESCMNGMGADITLDQHADELDSLSLLFSESQGRAIVCGAPENVDAILAIAGSRGIPAQAIGTTVTAALVIRRRQAILVRTAVPEIRRIWSEALADLLSGASPDDVIRGRAEAVDVIAH